MIDWSKIAVPVGGVFSRTRVPVFLRISFGVSSSSSSSSSSSMKGEKGNCVAKFHDKRSHRYASWKRFGRCYVEKYASGVRLIKRHCFLPMAQVSSPALKHRCLSLSSSAKRSARRSSSSHIFLDLSTAVRPRRRASRIRSSRRACRFRWCFSQVRLAIQFSLLLD